MSSPSQPALGRERKGKDGPTAIDAHVGSRIRARRGLLGMSQKYLGQQVDLTFQQIQKYERGANRIGSGRLFEFSRILDVPISYFFDSMPTEIDPAAGETMSSDADKSMTPDANLFDRRDTIEMVRVFHQIDDKMVRQKFVELMREAARVCV